MKGLGKRNTHVKYESPSTCQSKVITKVKVLMTDGQTAIRGALKSKFVKFMFPDGWKGP
jgi:hypothetical protein